MLWNAVGIRVVVSKKPYQISFHLKHTMKSYRQNLNQINTSAAWRQLVQMSVFFSLRLSTELCDGSSVKAKWTLC